VGNHGKPPKGAAKGPLRRHGLVECLDDFVAAAQRSAGFVEGVVVDLGVELHVLKQGLLSKVLTAQTRSIQ
jgi:hypothetical protein